MKEPYIYNCTLVRVVDGDTIVCDIDLGFDVVLSEQFIRLAGIDAPESRCRRPIEKKLGLLAKERLTEILKDTFKLQSLGKGKFGRILGIPYVDNVDVCATLITEGHAVEYEGGKKTKVWGE